MALPTRVNRGMTGPDDTFQREFETVLGRWLGGAPSGNGSAPHVPYAVDVREDVDHFFVEAELPGFKKEDVEITLENQTLTITAERRSDAMDEKKGELILNERRYSRFLRSFTLPPTVNEQSVNAKLNQGVLTIVLNKREESKPRRIQVA